MFLSPVRISVGVRTGMQLEFSVRCAQEFGDGSFSRFVRKKVRPFCVLGEIRKILFNRYLMIRRLL